MLTNLPRAKLQPHCQHCQPALGSIITPQLRQPKRSTATAPPTLARKHSPDLRVEAACQIPNVALFPSCSKPRNPAPATHHPRLSDAHICGIFHPNSDAHHHGHEKAMGGHANLLRNKSKSVTCKVFIHSPSHALTQPLTHSTPLHSTPLHFTLLHSMKLYFTPPDSTPIHSTPLYLTPLNYTPPYSNPVYSTDSPTRPFTHLLPSRPDACSSHIDTCPCHAQTPALFTPKHLLLAHIDTYFRHTCFPTIAHKLGNHRDQTS